MANRADVEIRGKETVSQEAQKAGKALDDVGGKSKTLIKSFTDMKSAADTVVAVIKKVAAVANEAVQAFVEIEKAERAFNAAMSQAPQMTKGATDRLSEFAEAIARVTGADDDAVRSLETFLAQAGRTETQIKSTMMAAANLAASGFGTLEANVEQINLTFSGTAGRLNKLIPEFDSVTESAFEAGAAADIINKKFGGLLGTLSGSSEVSINNFKNLMDDYKGALGQGIELLLKPIRDAFTNLGAEHLDEFKSKVKDIGLTIRGIFENLPEFVKLVFQTIWDIIEITFKWETVSEIFKTWVTNIMMMFSAAFKSIPAILRNMLSGKGITFDSVWGMIKDTLAAEGQMLQNYASVLGDLYKVPLDNYRTALAGFKAVEGSSGATGQGLNVASSINPYHSVLSAEYVPSPFQPAGIENAYKIIAEPLQAISDQLEETLGGSWGGGEASVFGAVSPAQREAQRQAFTYMGRVPQGGGLAEEDLGGKWGGGALSIFKPIYPAAAGGPQYAPDSGREYARSIGVIGNGEKGGTEIGNLFAGLSSIGGIFGDIAGQILPFITSLSSINKILNPFQTILGGFFEVIGPVLNLVLKPLVDALEDIGRAAAEFLLPAFKWLAIGVEYVVAPLQWLADALKWVGEQLGIFIDNLSNAIWEPDKAYTEFVSDAFTGLGERIAKINAWDLGKIVEAPETTAKTTGSSTTIQKAPDIYNYFHFHAPVIGAGGAREVGEYVIGAIQEYVGSGGKVTYQEA